MKEEGAATGASSVPSAREANNRSALTEVIVLPYTAASKLLLGWPQAARWLRELACIQYTRGRPVATRYLQPIPVYRVTLFICILAPTAS